MTCSVRVLQGPCLRALYQAQAYCYSLVVCQQLITDTHSPSVWRMGVSNVTAKCGPPAHWTP